MVKTATSGDAFFAQQMLESIQAQTPVGAQATRESAWNSTFRAIAQAYYGKQLKSYMDEEEKRQKEKEDKADRAKMIEQEMAIISNDALSLYQKGKMLTIINPDDYPETMTPFEKAQAFACVEESDVEGLDSPNQVGLKLKKPNGGTIVRLTDPDWWASLSAEEQKDFEGMSIPDVYAVFQGRSIALDASKSELDAFRKAVSDANNFESFSMMMADNENTYPGIMDKYMGNLTTEEQRARYETLHSASPEAREDLLQKLQIDTYLNEAVLRDLSYLPPNASDGEYSKVLERYRADYRMSFMGVYPTSEIDARLDDKLAPAPWRTEVNRRATKENLGTEYQEVLIEGQRVSIAQGRYNLEHAGDPSDTRNPQTLYEVLTSQSAQNGPIETRAHILAEAIPRIESGENNWMAEIINGTAPSVSQLAPKAWDEMKGTLIAIVRYSREYQDYVNGGPATAIIRDQAWSFRLNPDLLTTEQRQSLMDIFEQTVIPMWKEAMRDVTVPIHNESYNIGPVFTESEFMDILTQGGVTNWAQSAFARAVLNDEDPTVVTDEQKSSLSQAAQELASPISSEDVASGGSTSNAAPSPEHVYPPGKMLLRFVPDKQPQHYDSAYIMARQQAAKNYGIPASPGDNGGCGSYTTFINGPYAPIPLNDPRSKSVWENLDAYFEDLNWTPVSEARTGDVVIHVYKEQHFGDDSKSHMGSAGYYQGKLGLFSNPRKGNPFGWRPMYPEKANLRNRSKSFAKGERYQLYIFRHAPVMLTSAMTALDRAMPYGNYQGLPGGTRV